MQFVDKHLIEAGDMSADITSEKIPTEQIYMGSFQANRVGTATGNFIIQGSNDGVNFKDLTTVAASALEIVEFTEFTVKYVRFFFDFTANTGTLDVHFFAKGV